MSEKMSAARIARLIEAVEQADQDDFITAKTIVLTRVFYKELLMSHAALQREADNGARFKAYVHQRLDDAGIPTHPDGEHSAAGCRVGDRLDIALSYKREAEAERARAERAEGSLRLSEEAHERAVRHVERLDDLLTSERARADAMREALEAAEGHLTETLSDSRWHPIGHCPVLDQVRAALSQARGEPKAPEQQSSAEWTDDDQANTDFVSDIACEISADDDVVHSVLGALTERNLFDWSAARKEIRTRYGEPPLSSEGK